MDLVLVGDVMLGRLVNEKLKTTSPEHPWGDTLPIFHQADFRVCNLECVISDRGEPWTLTPKVFHFRSDAKNIEVLRRAHIDAVSLANNHILDFGYDALFDTRKILDEAAIRHSGAGANASEAARASISQVDHTEVGLIAFTDNEPAWEATDQHPGTFYVPIDVNGIRAKRLFETVRRAKAEVELLIVSAHWGPNWGYTPPAEHVQFARALIDAGSDVIFGHSGHVFRGIEFHRGRPVIYCAGDFIDDYAIDAIERNDESFIFNVETRNGDVEGLKLYPTLIRDLQARLADGVERERMVKKMQRLCAEFGTRTCWQEAGYLAVGYDPRS
ncbi:MAG TPA: CapA family protein [Candidatus Eisenbacteria bacterium]|nr:CapA family protein [Candidatus Eisenbacteria bacterium]